MNNFKITEKKGFTLIEIVVAVAIFSVLIFVAIDLVSSIYTNSKQDLAALGNIQQSTLAVSRFTNEIRSAAYGNNGAYPVTQAGNSEITFYSSYGIAFPAVKKIHYYVLNNVLYKGVINPSGNPLSYSSANEVVYTVQSDLEGADPIFKYYNDAYQGSGSSLAQPVNLNQIKFVKINLSVLKQIKAGSGSSYSVGAGAAIRNLKTNLGN